MDFNFLQNLMLAEEQYVLDIHTAASIGCDEVVVDILKSDPSKLNAHNAGGWTPLMYAACLAHLRTVALLLERGANVHSALLVAAKGGNTEVVAMLLQAGAESEVRDARGQTAVTHAAKLGHRSVLLVLVEKGASITTQDDEGLTPLMLASSAGHEMVVKDLLKLGANVNAQSKCGETARSLAAKNGHLKVVNILDSSSSRNHNPQLQKSGLQSLLQDLRLSKYLPLFERHGIDLELFWMLDETDLKTIGIQIVGPRKALCMAIAEHHQKQLASDDPRALRSLNSRLLLENKRLQQAKEELESKMYRETELRKEAEQSLNEGIKSLKSFRDVVLRTVTLSVALQEKLRQTLFGLKRVLLETGQGHAALPLVATAEKLATEVLNQSHLSLQQNTFRS